MNRPRGRVDTARRSTRTRPSDARRSSRRRSAASLGGATGWWWATASVSSPSGENRGHSTGSSAWRRRRRAGRSSAPRGAGVCSQAATEEAGRGDAAVVDLPRPRRTSKWIVRAATTPRPRSGSSEAVATPLGRGDAARLGTRNVDRASGRRSTNGRRTRSRAWSTRETTNATSSWNRTLRATTSATPRAPARSGGPRCGRGSRSLPRRRLVSNLFDSPPWNIHVAAAT